MENGKKKNVKNVLPSWILTCTELKGHWLRLF